MNIWDVLVDTSHQEASRIYGVVIGIVTNNQDPENLGRVKVRFPWLNNENESNWARIAVLMAGSGRGTYFLPEVEDEVLVLFDHGDVRFPYIIGSLWNGSDKPPANNEDNNNNIRMIQSRSGHVIRFDDTENSEKIEIIDKSQNNKIVFDTANNAIDITTDKDIMLSAAQGTIKLEAKNIEINSSANTRVMARGEMALEATTTTNIKGQPINLN